MEKEYHRHGKIKHKMLLKKSVNEKRRGFIYLLI